MQSERVAAGRYTALGWAGIILAGLAALAVVVLPAGWPAIILAGTATLVLAREPRLGWIGGGLLVTLAIPFGRAADLDPLTMGGVPVRPHDVVIGLTIVGSVIGIVRGDLGRPRRIPPARLSLLAASTSLALIGLVAIGWGLLEGQALRDILRDVRWWYLYLMAPIAILAGLGRDTLLRSLVAGTSIFGLAVVATLVLPEFPGGLKEAALTADSGALRMAFGNTIFLVPTTAYLTHLVLRRPRWVSAAALALSFGALVLSLTRISIMVTAAVVLVLVAASFLPPKRRLPASDRPRLHRRPQPALAVLLTVVVSAVASIALITAATFAVAGDGSGRSPLGRLLFEEEGSDMDAILGSAASGGRLATYVNAFEIIADSPVLGGGMGQQVEVQFAVRPGQAFNPGFQPGVDNAYLTAGVKAGALGIAALAALFLLPLRRAFSRLTGHPRLPRPAVWYLAAWLAILALTMTQSFAVSGYGPFGIALLAALPFVRTGVADTSRILT